MSKQISLTLKNRRHHYFIYKLSCLVCRMNGHSSAAERLLESVGVHMINTRDAKGRWGYITLWQIFVSLLNVFDFIFCFCSIFYLHKCSGLALRVWTVCACRTPLHAAAFAEDVAGLQLVLRHGVEINAVDRSGRSALMVAADKGHSGTVGM